MQVDALLDALATTRPEGVGIEAWSLHLVESWRLSLGIKDGQVGNAHTPLTLSREGGARYLFVWEDGRVSRGQFERGQIEIDTREALAGARAAAYEDPDAAWVLGPASFPHVRLHDAPTAAMARGEGKLWSRCLSRMREGIGDGGFETWSGALAAAETQSRIVTSAGLDSASAGTSTSWHLTLDGEIGDGLRGRRPEPGAAFESRLARLMETARHLRRPAEPFAGGVHRVLLHPRVVESYVLDTLLHHLDGAAIDHGESRFDLGWFGTDRAVLREDLRFHLDPLQPYKSGSYRFTREGLPASRCSFVENGRLVRPVLDLKYARRLGLAPSPLPQAHDALHFEGEQTLTWTRALDRAAGGVLVLAVLGVHTQDRASGDFSLAAPQVLRLGSSGFSGRLRATISGNLFDVLRDPALCFVSFPGEHTPGLLFPCRLDPK